MGNRRPVNQSGASWVCPELICMIDSKSIFTEPDRPMKQYL